jgi:antirestriction protein ArdC
MPREDRYWQGRCARLERKLADAEDEIARLKSSLRAYREACLVPATLKIVEEQERRTG